MTWLLSVQTHLIFRGTAGGFPSPSGRVCSSFSPPSSSSSAMVVVFVVEGFTLRMEGGVAIKWGGGPRRRTERGVCSEGREEWFVYTQD